MTSTLARLQQAILPAASLQSHAQGCDFVSEVPGSACFYEVVPLPQGEALYAYRTQGRTAMEWIQRSLGVPTTLAWDQATVDALYGHYSDRREPLDADLLRPGKVPRELVEAALAVAMARPKDRVLIRPGSNMPDWGQVPPDDKNYKGRVWRDNVPLSREAVLGGCQDETSCPVGCRPVSTKKITWQDAKALLTVPNVVAFSGYVMGFWWLLGGPTWAGVTSIGADVTDNILSRMFNQKSITSTQYDWIMSGSMTAMAASRLGLPPMVIAGVPIAQAFLRARDPDLPVGSFRSVLMAAVLAQEHRTGVSHPIGVQSPPAPSDISGQEPQP